MAAQPVPVHRKSHPLRSGAKAYRLGKNDPNRYRSYDADIDHKERKVGGRTYDPSETYCGCFLPDLTGLARYPSTADLPRDA
ncbi:hypothetical protein AA0488_1338 [Kozakia baliensis NRIC 0488]|nr:hypothetical protein AA0488_1338 [Kozakia baliensis NRIC 0488]